jgi:putative endonuclease
MWSVYVLCSERIRRSYVGCSADVDGRLRVHNAGQVRATRGGTPWRLGYTEAVGTYLEVRRRERYYKSAAGRRRLKTIFEGMERWPSGLRRSTGNAVYA